MLFIKDHKLAIQFLRKKDAKEFINIYKNDEEVIDNERNLFNEYDQKITNAYGEITYLWSDVKCSDYTIGILEQKLKEYPKTTLFGHIGENIGHIRLIKYGDPEECFSEPIKIETPSFCISSFNDPKDWWQWNR